MNYIELSWHEIISWNKTCTLACVTVGMGKMQAAVSWGTAPVGGCLMWYSSSGRLFTEVQLAPCGRLFTEVQHSVGGRLVRNSTQWAAGYWGTAPSGRPVTEEQHSVDGWLLRYSTQWEAGYWGTALSGRLVTKLQHPVGGCLLWYSTQLAGVY